MLKIISGISFFLAMLCAVVLLTNISVPFSKTYLIYGVIGLGAFGVIINLLNVQQSKHNILYSIVYWLSCLILIFGITFRIMHWPFSNIALIVGVSGLLVSMFLPKTKVENKNENKELLDDFN